ncbi:deoxynucleoside triphosphate triphosphohydrolase SAMHD1-like [Anguilla rostrata]|uniref:deoxynucleoside triphosphate triphosphohydrolase SAMHD1-like n=1 Tax=Anguilla rostrata TaxID=7938 RepID=UPI0030D580F5
MAGGTSYQPYKIFNDPIHGSIEMHPYLVRIIDTPEFQRLRYIRQMGSVYFVYPGASHNRFEHSIGVAHLAGELVQQLNRRYHHGEDTELDKKLQEIHEERMKELTTKHEKELVQLKQQDASSDNQESEPREQCKLEEEHKNQLQKLEAEQHVLITKDEGLCVQIGALCHDLGHGPFSHQFDDLFIPKVVEKLSAELEGIPDGEMKREKETKKNTLENWTHEEQSGSMLEMLIGNISDTECRAFIDTHKDFIKELIDPRGEIRNFKNPKTFLYEIVSNKRNGIDVDKMDYFSRDCYHLGIESNFNCGRFFKFARVCVCDGEMQICMRDKEVGHIYDLYQTRNNIHQKACQHKVVSAIDTMIVDALLLADKTLNISGSVLDATKYRGLTDAIYQNILNYEKIKCETEDLSNIKKAQEILKRIESRDLYTCVYYSRLDATLGIKNKREHEQDLEERLQAKYASEAKEKEFAVRIINLASGKKGEDPIKHMKFYSKQNHCTAEKLERTEVSQLLPNVFSETVLHIFRKNSKKTDISAESSPMNDWCQKYKCKLSK